MQLPNYGIYIYIFLLYTTSYSSPIFALFPPFCSLSSLSDPPLYIQKEIIDSPALFEFLFIRTISVCWFFKMSLTLFSKKKHFRFQHTSALDLKCTEKLVKTTIPQLLQEDLAWEKDLEAIYCNYKFTPLKIHNIYKTFKETSVFGCKHYLIFLTSAQ